MVPADGAVVHHDVPGPQRHRVPLLHLEPLLLADLACAPGGPGGGHLGVTVKLHDGNMTESERSATMTQPFNGNALSH